MKKRRKEYTERKNRGKKTQGKEREKTEIMNDGKEDY
jgi:hypothetical protein